LAANTNEGKTIDIWNWYPAAGTGDTNPSPQQNLLNQLDSSVFLTPLVYSISNSQQNQNTNSKPGAPTSLTAQNQIQAAQNFLRYLSGTILPPTLPTKSVFDSLIQKIRSTDDQQQQINSFDSLTSYLLGVRVFAARQSVAIQNIYEMLSKRIPLDSRDKTLTGSSTSQAMDEFIMASYRLFTPNPKPNSGVAPSASAWQTKISGASSATVQKEMVILLAEINYQLYQMRQQQERMLLTQSLIMMNGNNYPLLQDND
jgi:intracellular multiplication protein IcmX